MTLIIMKSLDPLRAKITFKRKKLSHTAVSAIKASSVTLLIWQKEPEENTVYLKILILNLQYFLNSQNLKFKKINKLILDVNFVQM